MDIDQYSPSQRAYSASARGKAWDLIGLAGEYSSFDPELNPSGVINLMGAKNSLMRDWTEAYVKASTTVETSMEGLSYGSPAGSLALRNSAAGFLNRHFCPSLKIDHSQVLATNGVTSAIDLLVWALCEPGDAILYPTPTFYMLGFNLAARNGVQTIPVPIRQNSDASAAEDIEAAFQRAIDEAVSNNIRCRGLFLCNPTNPQGRCYDPSTLNRLAQLCTRHGMHLISSEIYAMSNFSGGEEPFSSVLSIPEASSAKFRNIHCMYGMSKDFGFGGLRMGLLVTRNEALLKTLKKISLFTWISNGSDLFTTTFLQRTDLVDEYIRIYQERLGAAYGKASKALVQHRIKFHPAKSGLFIFIDLRAWLRFFPAPQFPAQLSQELQLWKWLLDNGVALNPGECAESKSPGWFRLVFSGNIPAVIMAVSRLRAALDRLEVLDAMTRNGKRPSMQALSSSAMESSAVMDKYPRPLIRIELQDA